MKKLRVLGEYNLSGNGQRFSVSLPRKSQIELRGQIDHLAEGI